MSTIVNTPNIWTSVNGYPVVTEGGADNSEIAEQVADVEDGDDGNPCGTVYVTGSSTS